MKIITMHDISKKYGDHILFQNYNLEVEKGDFLAIMGKSGCGKTTLLNMIGMLEKPDSGEIKILEEVNPNIDRNSGRLLLRKHISYLFQNYGLIDDKTVEYNIRIVTRYSNYKTKDTIISDALSRVGLKGIEKKKIYQLSGGEQQRVALAKIIVKPTDIILADEPTGSLDAESKKKVMEILTKLNDDGKTIIMVTHDRDVAGYAKHIKML